MKKVFTIATLVGLLTLGVSLPASAGCYGSSSVYNCYDYQSGNSYSVQKYGNSTYMQGYNAGTGSSWSQNSNSFGNTTFHNGTDSRGNSWSTTCQSIGGQFYCN